MSGLNPRNLHFVIGIFIVLSIAAKVQHIYETDQFTVGQQVWLSHKIFSSQIWAIKCYVFCEMLNKSMMQVVDIIMYKLEESEKYLGGLSLEFYLCQISG